jgi:hypothetical protein
MRHDELPFTAHNRPWLTSGCIEAMNMRYMACLSNIPPEYHEALRDWAAIKVEMGTCHEKPDVRERCEGYGQQWVSAQEPLSTTLFMNHEGHLTVDADDIAGRHDAWHVNHTEPNGRKCGWFACSNLGDVYNMRIAKLVREAIEKAGGIEGLQMPEERAARR